MSNSFKEYKECLQCKLIVPSYFLDQHTEECSSITIPSHPFIKGDIMQVQLNFYKNIKETFEEEIKPKKKKRDKSNLPSKTFIEEPDFLREFFEKCSPKIVVINDRDLVKAKIKGYSNVGVQVGDVTTSFIAIPYPNMKSGVLGIYDTVYNKTFKGTRFSGLATIKGLRNIPHADEIFMKTDKPITKGDIELFEMTLKRNFSMKFPVGSPFVYTNNEAYTLACVDYRLFSSFENMQNCIEKNAVSDKIELDFDDRELNSPENEMLQDMDAKELNLREKGLDLNITDQNSTNISEITQLLDNINLDSTEYHSFTSNDDSKYYSINNTSLSTDNNTKCNISSISHLKSNLVTSTPKRTSMDCDTTQDLSINNKTIEEFFTNIDLFMITENSKINICCPVIIPNEEKTTLKEQSLTKLNGFESLKKIVSYKLNNKGREVNPLLGDWNGILLEGPSGCGKKSAVRLIAKYFNLYLDNINILDTIGDDVTDDLSAKFIQLMKKKIPSIILIENLDWICPLNESKESNSVTSTLVKNIDLVLKSHSQIILIATTSKSDMISTKLRRAGRFDKEIKVMPCNRIERFNVLNDLLSNTQNDISCDTVERISGNCYGYNANDLNALFKLAMFERLKKAEINCDSVKIPPLIECDLLNAINKVTPTQYHQHDIPTQKVTWKDIYGYDAIKNNLKNRIENYKCDPDNNPLKGLLLYGPPGCSKTMFVRALVHETSFSYFPIKCSSLLSKYVGETEKSLSNIFKNAEIMSPSLIFIDEIDGLCGERSGSGKGIVSELLSLLSHSKKQNKIMFVAATNRPSALDEALLAPGCLDEIIHVTLPDCKSRCAIWEGILFEKPIEEALDVKKLCEATNGYSGAEIKAIYQEAAQRAIADVIPKEELSECLEDGSKHVQNIQITFKMLLDAMQIITPRTPQSLLKTIEEFVLIRKGNRNKTS